jgi:hypothetical protein
MQAISRRNEMRNLHHNSALAYVLAKSPRQRSRVQNRYSGPIVMTTTAMRDT